MLYPDFFPCPNWSYNKQTTEHLRRVQFANGWTRQRKRFAERNQTVSLTLTMSSAEFASWSTWWVNNAYDWFEMVLAQGPATVRAVSPINYAYRVFDTINVSVTVEEHVFGYRGQIPGDTPPGGNPPGVPVPVPPHETLPPIPGTEVYCLEYQCDSYNLYMESNSALFWPCDNPTSDGYLEGTVDLPCDNDLVNINMLQDACVVLDGWKTNGASSGVIGNGLDIGSGDHLFSYLYKYGGGATDTMISVRQVWNVNIGGSLAHKVYYTLGTTQNGAINIYIEASNAGIQTFSLPDGTIPNDGLPHVLAWRTLGIPGNIIQAQTGYTIGVEMYVDWEPVGGNPEVANPMNSNPEDGIYDPTDSSYVFNIAGGSSDANFAAVAVDGGVDFDIEEARRHFEANNSDYIDPDPDCIPQPTSQMTDPIATTVIVEP